MTTPLDHSRTEWYPANLPYLAGDPVVRSSSGNPRPHLPTPLTIFTVHYIGAGSTWLDTGDTADELASIEANHAIPIGAPNEYNSASDTESATWEWAGPYRAAHSKGENGISWGHLIVCGIEIPTETQATAIIIGVRRARQQLVNEGYLTKAHAVTPHTGMLGAATPCPGPFWDNPLWWQRIAAPLTEQETDMTSIVHIRIRGYKNQFAIINGKPVPLTQDLLRIYGLGPDTVHVIDLDNNLRGWLSHETKVNWQHE